MKKLFLLILILSFYSSLILAQQTKIYGTTEKGGNNNAGVIFHINESNQVVKDYDFPLVEGKYPHSLCLRFLI